MPIHRRGRRLYLCEHPTELYSFAEDIDVEGIAERPAIHVAQIHYAYVGRSHGAE